MTILGFFFSFSFSYVGIYLLQILLLHQQWRFTFQLSPLQLLQSWIIQFNTNPKPLLSFTCQNPSQEITSVPHSSTQTQKQVYPDPIPEFAVAVTHFCIILFYNWSFNPLIRRIVLTTHCCNLICESLICYTSNEMKRALYTVEWM